MDRKYALLFSILITGLIASNVFILHLLSAKDSRQLVTLLRVIDGDTLVLQDGRHIRFLNINAPEKGTPNANLSADFLRQFIGQQIILDITGVDKYQRTLARAYSSDGDYLNLKLVTLGYSSKFLVDPSELKDFNDAENNAVNRGIGIWKKSPSFGCIKSSADSIEETVALENTCPEISVSGWYLKDESRKVYKFNNITFQKGEIITLHSSYGDDNSTDIFWNSISNIWNDDRDTVYLFDKEGNIVSQHSYGY